MSDNWAWLAAYTAYLRSPMKRAIDALCDALAFGDERLAKEAQARLLRAWDDEIVQIYLAGPPK